MSATVFKLPPPGGEPITEDLPGWTPIEGSPWMKTWIQHTSADGSFLVGTWRAGVGTYRAAYSAHEFVHLIEGRIVITPDGGESVTVGPGDAFMVEPTFRGAWRIEEPVLKHFSIRAK